LGASRICLWSIICHGWQGDDHCRVGGMNRSIGRVLKRGPKPNALYHPLRRFPRRPRWESSNFWSYIGHDIGPNAIMGEVYSENGQSETGVCACFGTFQDIDISAFRWSSRCGRAWLRAGSPRQCFRIRNSPNEDRRGLKKCRRGGGAMALIPHYRPLISE
jgi:hypothetical protein